MTKLAYLHEPGTYTGGILIAINPFQRLPHLYENRVMEKYKGASVGELSPHPFAIADSAYRQMIKEQISQAILVSGESGAGKTESTKMLMQYLAFMGGRNNNTGERSVEQKVLESNPVLEAFGNAKTVRNNNSSRFGKFVEIQFDGRGRISGAAIRTYLLERSRVCQVSDPERNYHCFYMLCAAPPEGRFMGDTLAFFMNRLTKDVNGEKDVNASVMCNRMDDLLTSVEKELGESKGVDQPYTNASWWNKEANKTIKNKRIY
ncbi:hypothetical protein Goari_025231 [Gossypium aridum]|uniref:Myosin motor domain-containing protein n=1 Tax=Gossypium aridum TaxID=34290 RepID=A0A7J8X8H2_GOSAI|nr:hypothetical protein [Gossypium aridum]